MIYSRYLLLCTALFASFFSDAQSGCTDPAATNYDPSAIVNDGSCIYPVTHNTPVLRAALNPIITESSGLIWTDGKLWTHNDSGNPPDIFNVDTTDGHTIQTVVIDNYPNVDWESISADSNYIYVGDDGNNRGDRSDLKILKIAKADITSGSVVHVNAEAISFSYTDQTSLVASSTNNFDCEALISIRDSLYIFTKDRGDHSTRVYQLPKVPGTYAVTPYTSYDVDGLITDANYNAATNEIVLIGYMQGHVYSFLWFLSDYNGVQFFSGNKRRVEIGSGAEWQTEGVSYVSDSRYFISCESTDSIPASIFADDGLLNITPTAVSTLSKHAAAGIYPNPVSGILHADHITTSCGYTIYDAAGRAVCSGALCAGDNAINVEGLIPGAYFLEIDYDDAERTTARFTKQ